MIVHILNLKASRLVSKDGYLDSASPVVFCKLGVWETAVVRWVDAIEEHQHDAQLCQDCANHPDFAAQMEFLGKAPEIK